jgi:hypothetical protein
LMQWWDDDMCLILVNQPNPAQHSTAQHSTASKSTPPSLICYRFVPVDTLG